MEYHNNVLGRIQSGMWMQQGSIWHLDKIEFSVDLETSSKNTQVKI